MSWRGETSSDLEFLGGMRTYTGTAPPTGPPPDGKNSWQVGDRVRNSAPVAGGTTGWICVTAGNPGVWKAEASIAP